MTGTDNAGVWRRRLAWTFFWIYNAFVISGSVAPPSSIPRIFVLANDKVIHGIEYFILYWVAWNAFGKSVSSRISGRAWMLALGYALLMGCFTEWLQKFAPPRSCDLYDFAADALGSGSAFALYLFANKYAKRLLY